MNPLPYIIEAASNLWIFWLVAVILGAGMGFNAFFKWLIERSLREEPIEAPDHNWNNEGWLPGESP
jgi:hypothetical protein